MPAASGSSARSVLNETYTFVAGLSPVSPVQWPAVSTTVGEISVPEHRNRPASVVNRMSPTLVCTVSRCPSMIAEAGGAVARPRRSISPPVTAARGAFGNRLIAHHLVVGISSQYDPAPKDAQRP